MCYINVRFTYLLTKKNIGERTESLLPSNVCWSSTSRDDTSTSSPNMWSVSELEPDITSLAPVPDELKLWARVLALGRAGAAPLLSWMSIRIVNTPNVFDDSWYAMRLCNTDTSVNYWIKINNWHKPSSYRCHRWTTYLVLRQTWLAYPLAVQTVKFHTT